MSVKVANFKHSVFVRRLTKSRRMTISMFKMKKKWLWLLLSVWLLVLQSVALSHSAAHALEEQHSHCLLCNFDDNPSAGPTTVRQLPALLQRAEYIAFPLVQAPALAWLRKLNVRAPPSLF